jgi:hypothetical protein
MPVVDRPGAAVDDGLRVRPTAGKELDGIEADPDQHVTVVDDGLFDRRVGKDTAKPRVIVGHDTLGFVGHHRGHAASLAEAANGRGIFQAPRPEADE